MLKNAVMIKKRTVLTIKEKTEIYKFSILNKTIKHQEIAQFFSRKFNKSVSRQVVDMIMKKASFLFNNSNAVKRIMPIQDKRIDNMILQWIGLLNSKGVPVSDKLVQEQALKIAKKLEIVNFKASNGWLSKFKKRNKLKSYYMCGETGGINSDDIVKYRENLKTELKNFARSDIYNLDETALFFRYSPSRTINFDSIKGRKKNKERITVLLCTNADGSDKRKPLVIGKFANPRCFKNFNKDAFVDYYYNGKAWMTSKEYVSYIEKFDNEMREKQRKIALIVDNAPGHKVVETTNIKIIFLPPNLTGFLQPLDAGIIKSFKALYRHQQMSFLLDIFDDINLKSECGDLFKLISYKEAFIFIRHAWDNLTNNTIKNCWDHTKILCEDIINANKSIKIEETNEFLNCRKEINEIINFLAPNSEFTANDIITIIDENDDNLNEDDVLDLNTNNEENEQSEDSKNDTVNEEITISKARNALDTLKDFFFQKKDCSNTDINYLEYFTFRLRKDFKNYRQSKISEWFKNLKNE